MSKRLRHTIIAGCGLALLVCGLAIIYTHNPETSRWSLPCPFHAMTGLECPSCGSTRAVYYLMHGEVSHALSFNPFIVISWPLAAVIIWLSTFKPKGIDPKWAWRLTYVFATLLIAWWIGRNIAGI